MRAHAQFERFGHVHEALREEALDYFRPLIEGEPKLVFEGGRPDMAQAGGIMVDGLGVGDVGNVVLRDRQNLAQNGIMIVTIALERGVNQLAAGPEIVSRGFVYVKDSEDLMAEAREIAAAALRDSLTAGVSDWSKLKNVVRDELSDFFWKRMKRNPVILPIIMGIH